MASAAERLLSHVEVQIQAGRLWRAKEILRGAIASGQLDVSVLERYGQVLDSVGDRVDAGKYLFLSGVRRPEYDSAIQLFLRRHSRGGPENLAAQFPTRVRHRPFSEFPARVIGELVDLGVTAAALAPPRKRLRVSKPGPGERAVIGAVVLAIFGAFIVGALVGMRTIVGWVRALFG